VDVVTEVLERCRYGRREVQRGTGRAADGEAEQDAQDRQDWSPWS
jgi:hypothetical protein